MFLHVLSVGMCSDYCLECGFNTGETLHINCSKELYSEVFAPLLDKQYFTEVHINLSTLTVEWISGADFAPEFLYALAQKQVHSSEILSTP